MIAGNTIVHNPNPAFLLFLQFPFLTKTKDVGMRLCMIVLCTCNHPCIVPLLFTQYHRYTPRICFTLFSNDVHVQAYWNVWQPG